MARKNATKNPKKCANCGKALPNDGGGTTRRFCNIRCKEAYYLNPHTIVCSRCGSLATVSSYTRLCQKCRDESEKRHHKTDRKVGAKYDDHEFREEDARERYEARYKGSSKGIDEYAKKDAERRRNGQAHISYGMAMAMKASQIKLEAEQSKQKKTARSVKGKIK